MEKSSEQIVKEALNKLIEDLRPVIFEKGYENKYSDQEVLGIAVSKFNEWDGAKTVETFLSALEDSNFHTLAEQVQKLAEEEMK